jgi:hypothetical protein
VRVSKMQSLFPSRRLGTTGCRPGPCHLIKLHSTLFCKQPLLEVANIPTPCELETCYVNCVCAVIHFRAPRAVHSPTPHQKNMPMPMHAQLWWGGSLGAWLQDSETHKRKEESSKRRAWGRRSLGAAFFLAADYRFSYIVGAPTAPHQYTEHNTC